jgi:hypothetical protein
MTNNQSFIRELEFYFNEDFSSYGKDKLVQMINEYIHSKSKMSGMNPSDTFIMELELFLDTDFNDYTKNRINGLLIKYFNPITIRK